MHTTRGPSGLYYHHNGDYSGDVMVTVPFERATPDPYSTYVAKAEIDEQQRKVTVDIPFEDMRRLVLAHLRSKLIEELEQADDDKLEQLLLKFGTKGQS